MNSDRRVYQIINEEMSKSEIASLIDSKFSSKMSSREFEKKIKEITASVISEVFKVLWQRNNTWKSSVTQ